MSLGRKLGEPVCVEEETQNRARLDRGMVFVKVPLVWLCPDQINVEMGGKCFVVKIEEEQFSFENLGIFPVDCAGTLIPVEGGSAVDICEEARRLTDDGDKATHEDSYERAEVSAGVLASPIPLKFHFENLADFDVHRGVGVNSKGSGGKGPSEEKVRDEVGIAGPRTICSSVVKDVLSGSPGLFQIEGYVPLHGSEVPSEKRSSKYDISYKIIRGRRDPVVLKKHNMTPRSFNVGAISKKQNSESVNLKDDIAKVLEKGLALGLNFKGKREELLDIINKRNVANDNRFRDLVSRLVMNFKAKGC
ncbi:hypothetical protein Q3G72_033886 [Acer saccharum]|nr:hypothetical protein Q3G72_033886 [Acer saccharum]